MPPPSHLIAAKLLKHSYHNSTFEAKKTDIQVYTQDIRGVRYIVFPGTNSLLDWYTSFRTRSLVTPYKGGGYKGQARLHKGYYLAYLSIREHVLSLADTDLYLVVGGHSMGGAIAQIAAVDINYQLNKQVETITLGSPACGNKEWAKSAAVRITNTSYVNCLDVIPFLMYWNYHVCKLNHNSFIYLDPHNIGNYVNALKLLCHHS